MKTSNFHFTWWASHTTSDQCNINKLKKKVLTFFEVSNLRIWIFTQDYMTRTNSGQTDTNTADFDNTSLHFVYSYSLTCMVRSNLINLSRDLSMSKKTFFKKQVQANLIFINYYYCRTVLDHLFLHQIQPKFFQMDDNDTLMFLNNISKHLKSAVKNIYLQIWIYLHFPQAHLEQLQYKIK